MCQKIEKIDIFDNGSIPMMKIRDATKEEIDEKMKNGKFSGMRDMHIKEKECDINNVKELVEYGMEKGFHNGLGNAVDERLKKNQQYQNAQSKKTPPSILKYQKTNKLELQDAVNKEIQDYGVIIHKDQVLYHGGLLEGLSENSSITTTRTLSTTLNPEVAHAECYHKWKAYEANEINLNILTVKDEGIKGLVFNNRTSMKHEREILFERNIKLVMKNKQLCGYSEVEDKSGNAKNVPKYITEIEIYKSDY